VPSTNHLIDRVIVLASRPCRLAYPMLWVRAAMRAATTTNVYVTRQSVIPNQKDLASYFEYSQSGIQVVEDGLKEIGFGEFLVEEQVLDRYQLFRALQMQDRLPGVRLGECAAALGYAPINAIEKIYARYVQLQTVAVG
jgi:hypothetical protein